VAEQRVRDGRDERGEHEVAAEAHALRHRSGHERGGRADEAELEEEEGRHERAVAVVEERRTTDQTALIRAEHQPEAEQPEQRSRDEEVGEVLDRDVDRVLRSNQAALEGGEPCLHHQDKRSAE
jgi:hypothetical protein